MYQNNYIRKNKPNFFLNVCCLFILLLIIGCSSDETEPFKNAVNVFETKTVFNVDKNDALKNVKIGKPVNNLNILNSNSNNLTNSFIKYPLNKIWNINTDQSLSDETPFLSEPIYILSNIYLINANGKLIKINSKNGNVVWEKNIFENLDNSLIGPPAISGKYVNDDVTIFLHTGNNEIFSVNGSTGEINWKNIFNLPFRGGLTYFQDRLYVSDYEGTTFSLNSNNGKIVWQKSLGTDYNSIYTKARPIIAKDKLIIPGTGGSFFVLSLKSGDLEWTENISSNSQLPKLYHVGDIVANPLYYKNVIYIVSQSGFISAFDLRTSENIWTLPVGGIETPTLSDETIFINGNEGNLVAINRIKGEIIWHNKYEGRVNVNSYFSNEAIAIYKGPVLSNSKLLLSDHHGTIKIIDSKNGNELNTLSVGKLALAPMVVDRKVFFLRADGDLIAYE